MTITLQAVNELIASLVTAGELSIKETKVMALAKAYQQLAAENVVLKATSDDRRMFIMNGVQLGYIKVPTVETDPALETIRIAVSPQEPTPATDRIVAWIKADGVGEFAAYCGEENSVFVEAKAYYRSLPDAAYEFCSMLREGANEQTCDCSLVLLWCRQCCGCKVNHREIRRNSRHSSA